MSARLVLVDDRDEYDRYDQFREAHKLEKRASKAAKAKRQRHHWLDEAYAELEEAQAINNTEIEFEEYSQRGVA